MGGRREQDGGGEISAVVVHRRCEADDVGRRSPIVDEDARVTTLLEQGVEPLERPVVRPSVLIPDWNHTQVSRNSLSGKDAAMRRTISSVPARAISYSLDPSADMDSRASRMAVAPRSAMWAASVMSAISSVDLIIRWRMMA